MTTRRWYQFRLSTALLLMFAASFLLWLNTRQYPDRTIKPKLQIFGRGWPYAWQEYCPRQELHLPSVTATFAESTTVRWKHLALDAAVAFSILGAGAIVFEWLQRRREKSA